MVEVNSSYMEFGKLVSDLNIDTDVVLMSSDVDAISQSIVNGDSFKSLSNDIVQNAIDEAKKQFNVEAVSADIFNAMKEQVLDDYVLKRMLSTLMFNIISSYNDIVLDCLDGNPDNEPNIDAGGAY